MGGWRLSLRHRTSGFAADLDKWVLLRDFLLAQAFTPVDWKRNVFHFLLCPFRGFALGKTSNPISISIVPLKGRRGEGVAFGTQA